MAGSVLARRQETFTYRRTRYSIAPRRRVFFTVPPASPSTVAEQPPWPPPVVTNDPLLHSNAATFVSELLGPQLPMERSGARWEFSIELSSLDDARTRAWRGFLAKCQDENLVLVWSAYPHGRPQNYQSGTGWGTPRVNGIGQSGRSLICDGFTAATALVMGDFIAFHNGIFLELHMLTADVTADGSGNATLSLTPAIRSAPADNALVLLDGHALSATSRCGCEVRVDESMPASTHLGDFEAGFRLKFVEVPR